eukprot:scaffold18579_cov202-Isochrysis_galbana.AAC.2
MASTSAALAKPSITYMRGAVATSTGGDHIGLTGCHSGSARNAVESATARTRPTGCCAPKAVRKRRPDEVGAALRGAAAAVRCWAAGTSTSWCAR